MHTGWRLRLAKSDSLPAKMNIQSDLTDNEIAWIPYRLRLSGKEEESSSELPRPLPCKLDVEQEYFFVNGMKLIEKPGATTTTTQRPGISQDTVSWGDRGGGGLQHTQYIRRLVNLRDELITQEETALAKAVDRLRLHSISNKDMARYRLKLKEPGGDSPRAGPPGPAGPKPMMTTVEKFRQMRPQRRQPILFPLQGRQIIESSTNSNRSTPGSSREESVKSDTSTRPRGVDDTVKANLQRLMFPSSSIPNIGRKALRRHEALELRTQSLHDTRLHNKANRHRSMQPPFMSPPFRLQTRNYDQESGVNGDDSFTESEEESLQSSRQTPPPSPTGKLGTMIDGDRLDMEKLNQYYYIYCLPDQPSPQEEGKGLPPFPPTQGEAGVRPDGFKPKRTHSERRYNSEKTHSERHYGSEKTNARRPYSDHTSLAGVGSYKVPEMFCHSVHKRTMGMITGPDRISLPVIHASSQSSSSPSLVKGRPAGSVTETDSSSSQETMPRPAERRKRRIVIDMPHIIFSANTPDVTREPTLVETSTAHPERPDALNKTLKQSEIRQKELETPPMSEP